MDLKQATLALIVRGDLLLVGLKKRTAEIGGDTLNGPGGKVDPGETTNECVVRETQEEVGLAIDVTDEDLRAVITFHNGAASVWRVYVYLVTSFHGEPSDTDDMWASPVWWHSKDKLPFHRMLASDKEWIPHVLDGGRFNLQVYQNDNATELLQSPVFEPFAA